MKLYEVIHSSGLLVSRNTNEKRANEIKEFYVKKHEIKKESLSIREVDVDFFEWVFIFIFQLRIP